MGVKVRASTQIFDDLHLLLRPDDLTRLKRAVLSEPGPGEQRIYSIKRLTTSEFVIDWETVPQVAIIETKVQLGELQ